MTRDMPRRLSPPAPPGALLKRIGEQPQRQRSSGQRMEDRDYLALVRQMPCLSCGVEPCGEAAHVKFSSSQFGKKNKLGKRPDDEDALPLCADDHRLSRDAQHKGNEENFWLALGISPYQVTRALYAQRGDAVAMRAVIMVAIANRDRK